MATHNNNNNTDATITEERRHPTEPENLGCPRCDSTNTKFCYYNNYNLSQPRYFCKSCRRYWTRGGTLRNIPVGGGTRKNSKRSRSSSSLPVGPTVTPPPPTPLMFEIQKVVKNADEAVSKWQDDLELNMNQGSFTSLLTTTNNNANANANANANINTNASVYGFGLEYGIGQASYDELGFGLGASMSVGDDTHGQQMMGVVQNGGSNTWQFGGGEGMDGAGCFGWPDLAI